MKKILITGASGFIGRNLFEGLEQTYNIYNPASKELNLFDDNAVSKYLKKNKFSIVIHCATYNATRTSIKELTKVLDTNLRMFFNVARCNSYFDRMFYFGSGAEYDMTHYIPKMKEEYFDTHVPTDDYGFSKYIMAKHISSTDNIYDLRLFGCFGKYEDWRIRFISNAICKTIFNMDITLYKNAYFDYLCVEDLVKIMKLFIEKKNLKFKHYNVCTGKSIDLLSIAKIVREVSRKNLKIKITEKGFKKEYSGNNKRLLNEFGKVSFTSLQSSIKELMEWYKSHNNEIIKELL